MKCLLYIPTGEYINFSMHKSDIRFIDINFAITKDNFLHEHFITSSNLIETFVDLLNSGAIKKEYHILYNINLPVIEEEFQLIEISEIL